MSLLKLVTPQIIVRNYGNIIYDLVNKYNGLLSVNRLRKLEKTTSLKCDKALLDIKFLLTCKRFSIVPKLKKFNLPYTNRDDEGATPRRLLRSAIDKRRYEKQKMEKELDRLKTNVRSVVTGIEWNTIYRSVNNNVYKKREKILPTQRKKLKNLIFNKVIPFTSNEVVKNLSTLEFSTEKLQLLKYGLSNSIPPKQLRKTKVFITFDMIPVLLDLSCLAISLKMLLNLVYRI